jgi:hypothetical protein
MNDAIHPLQKLHPDAWNNIPICLVRAVKSLIDSGIATDQKLRQANSNVDTGLKKVLALNAKLEKEVTKKDEQMRALVDRVEKNLTNHFTAKQ